MVTKCKRATNQHILSARFAAGADGSLFIHEGGTPHLHPMHNDPEDDNMKFKVDRRGALVGFGVGLMGVAQSGPVTAAIEATLEPAAKNLRELSRVLAGIPRRRDFKAVPMILDKPDLWDAVPIAAVLAYKGGPKQAWDNTELAGPWLNGMRNSVNAQIWSFKEPNFLCVSATHGSAHLALFDQDMWDKYQLAKLAGGNISRNTFIVAPPASHDPGDFQSAEGAFSSKNNSVLAPAARRRVHGLPQHDLGTLRAACGCRRKSRSSGGRCDRR